MNNNTVTWTSVKDGLPPLGEEVIVIDMIEKISFGHIVDPEEAISYDGWNIPNVAFWKPCGYTQEMFDYYGYEELEGGEE